MKKDVSGNATRIYQEPKYPLFIDIKGARVCVIGAGKVAERKIETLLSYGADVTVIAPQSTDHLRELANQEKIELQLRSYQRGDLQNAFLVISATDDALINQAVYEEATAAAQLINVVDTPDLCNFYVPSVLTRGPLQIAISTSGAAPTVAKKLRRELGERYGAEWGTYVSLLGELRLLVLQRVPGGEAEHKSIFAMLAASGLYDRVAAGDDLQVEALYDELVLPLLIENSVALASKRMSAEADKRPVQLSDEGVQAGL